MKFKDYDLESLSGEMLKEIYSSQKPPCLSIYQSTHRQHPENLQDPIRFRGLVKGLETSLLQKYSREETEELLKPFEELSRNVKFWDHTLDGLAVLGCANHFRVIRIPRSVPNLAIVADSFHTKPLRRFLQSIDRYQVLGVSLNQIQLFEGNRHALDEIELVSEVPQTMDQALGDKYTGPHSAFTAYGGAGGKSVPMHHSHGGKQEQIEIDSERYFRAVDRAILEHYSKPSGLPLILASLPEHHNLFQRVSHNPHLISKGIEFYPGSLPIAELQKLAWKTIEPDYKAKLDVLNEEFTQAHSKKFGSDDLAQVAEAAASGQVKTLLIEADRQIGGRLNVKTGKVERDEICNPQVDDLLDDLGELVEKMNGRVQVVPAEKMPTQTGLAAIYRY